jgi:hypothetical protein
VVLAAPGSDSAACTQSAPCKTLQRAIVASHVDNGVVPTVNVLAGSGATRFDYRTFTTSILSRDVNIVGFRYEYNHTETVASDPDPNLNHSPDPDPGLSWEVYIEDVEGNPANGTNVTSLRVMQTTLDGNSSAAVRDELSPTLLRSQKLIQISLCRRSSALTQVPK